MKISVKFYEFLGMKQIRKLEYPENKFDLYFLAYDAPKSASTGNHWSDREGVVELTHNYGTEDDPNFKAANGNSEPGKGFGHLCVSVDNIQAACQRLEDAGYKFQKKLTDGRMKRYVYLECTKFLSQSSRVSMLTPRNLNSIAFALDPDGYWVEIIGQTPADKTENVKETDTGAYRMVNLDRKAENSTDPSCLEPYHDQSQRPRDFAKFLSGRDGLLAIPE